jgi:hypothetical protein
MASTDAKSSLSLTVPELRARFLDEQTHGLELLAPVLARKRGTSADELHLRVAARRCSRHELQLRLRAQTRRGLPLARDLPG